MKKADEILARLLELQSSEGRLYSSVFGGWGEIVGDSLAEHSRVYEMRHRCLLVDVDHPGWMQLLMLRKAAILGKLRRQYPQLEIRDLKVQLRAQGLQKDQETRTAPFRGQPKPAAETMDQIEQALSLVADAGLKERLRRLLQRSVERRGPMIDTLDDKKVYS